MPLKMFPTLKLSALAFSPLILIILCFTESFCPLPHEHIEQSNAEFKHISKGLSCLNETLSPVVPGMSKILMRRKENFRFYPTTFQKLF